MLTLQTPRTAQRHYASALHWKKDQPVVVERYLAELVAANIAATTRAELARLTMPLPEDLARTIAEAVTRYVLAAHQPAKGSDRAKT